MANALNEDTIQLFSRLYGSGSTDYTYSFWIYINDYNKNYGEKMILERKYSQSGTDTYYFPPNIFRRKSK